MQKMAFLIFFASALVSQDVCLSRLTTNCCHVLQGPFEQAFSDAEDEMDSSTLDSSSCSHSSIDSEDFTKDK